MSIDSPATHRFKLASGEVAAEIRGAESAPLVIGIPGLSANLRSFDVIFGALDPDKHRTLAYDPRGRGKSQRTVPGTYGWPSHARDIVEMADQLGAQQFDLVGWSMGTWIAMQVCEMYPGRVRKLVLIDGGGIPDEAGTIPVYGGLDRLGIIWPSREAFYALAQKVGVYEPWETWQRYFEYELEDVPTGGVKARTANQGPWEDEIWRRTHEAYPLWKSVTMPTLLLRATREIMPGCGYILTAADAERFVKEVKGSKLVEIDAGHYAIGVVPEAAKAIAEFLEG